MVFKNKKGMNEVGLGIIVMAVLLLLGGVFMDSDFSSGGGNEGYKNKDGFEDEDILWKINNSNLGRQVKETESFPNIELGSREKTEVIYIGNSFRLHANMFTKNEYSFDLSLANPEDVNYLLFYFNSVRVWGDNPIVIKYNGKQVLKTLAKKGDMPIKLPIVINNPENFSSVRVSFEVEKPAFYNLFNWNKVDFSEFKVVELSEDRSNRVRDFNFVIENKKFLENVYLDLLVECGENKEVSESIKVTVNDYIILNNNPSCLSKNSKLTGNVPLNILKESNNEVVFETEGYYTVGYSINKVYFNDQKNYKFNLNSFSNIGDVVMYGDYDRTYLDLRINSKTLSLRRNQVKSILDYLRLGVNEIKILNDKVEIEELVIENNRYN